MTSAGLTFAAVTLSLSLILFAYERTLVPLYGSGPTNHLLAPILLSVMLVASAGHTLQVSRRYSLLPFAVALSAAPNATYWVGVLTSRRKHSVLGPAFTHISVLGPLGFMLTTCLVRSDNRVQQATRVRVLKRLGVAFVSYWIALRLSRTLWPRVTLLRRISDSQIHLTLAFLTYSVWIATCLTTTPAGKHKVKALQSKLIVFVALIVWFWLLQPILISPILPHPLPAPYTRPDYPLRVLSAEQSVTGLIIVAEALPHEKNTGIHSVRYLRASHSLLGGVWLYGGLDNQQPVVDSFGTYLGDSIYAAFVLQEAVRLVNSTGRADKKKDGLIIGLGAGISASAFQRHGVSTTIVEIDPAVYDAARRYFGLPDPGPGRVFLEDARGWVSRQKLVDSKVLFDFVVHDCFSGGGVPEHIYTLEFWDDLSTLVGPEGVVAVNYAGVVKSESARLVLYTLLKVFQQCRAFHDQPGPSGLTGEKYETEFTNMVIFCTRSGSSLTFRAAQDSDYLGSPLRRHILGSLTGREVDIGRILDGGDGGGGGGGGDGYVLRDGDGRLARQQKGQGHYHWKVMREVLGDVHWETY